MASPAASLLLRWSKPALGLFEFEGSKQNNLLGVGGGSLAVLHDPIDPNPQRRFKRFAHRSGGYFAAYSPDGIRWHEQGARPVLTAGDTITLTQNPTTGEYLAFHKRPHGGAVATAKGVRLPCMLGCCRHAAKRNHGAHGWLRQREVPDGHRSDAVGTKKSSGVRRHHRPVAARVAASVKWYS